MMVKICGITNREDALAAAGAGAAALGFNCYEKSPRYIPLSVVQDIVEDLPGNILKVGVFVNTNIEIAARVAAAAGFDILQLHGNCEGFSSSLRLWRAVPARPGFQADSLDPQAAEAFLLDAPSDSLYGGTGTAFDWRLARGARAKVILAGGLDAGNVRRAIEEAQPWGVDACSRLERAPGLKDHRKMVEFLKAALS